VKNPALCRVFPFLGLDHRDGDGDGDGNRDRNRNRNRNRNRMVP